jgi:hypothetical protein
MTVVARAQLSLTRARGETKNGTLFATWDLRNEQHKNEQTQNTNTRTICVRAMFYLTRARGETKNGTELKQRQLLWTPVAEKIRLRENPRLGWKFLSPEFVITRTKLLSRQLNTLKTPLETGRFDSWPHSRASKEFSFICFIHSRLLICIPSYIHRGLVIPQLFVTTSREKRNACSHLNNSRRTRFFVPEKLSAWYASPGIVVSSPSRPRTEIAFPIPFHIRKHPFLLADLLFLFLSTISLGRVAFVSSEIWNYNVYQARREYSENLHLSSHHIDFTWRGLAIGCSWWENFVRLVHSICVLWREQNWAIEDIGKSTKVKDRDLASWNLFILLWLLPSFSSLLHKTFALIISFTIVTNWDDQKTITVTIVTQNST